MFSSFRNRFGIPGVISVIALVFAMLGGAYAASDNSGSGDAGASAKKKAKKGPRGPRGPRGPAGPAGPQGPAGPAGAKGDKGDAGSNGSNGTNGTNGKSVVVSNSAPGCAEGGVTVEVQDSGEENEVCNGEEGPQGPQGPQGNPWTAGGTLPSGATETGSWFALTSAVGTGRAAISFPIPLSAPISAANITVVSVGAGQSGTGNTTNESKKITGVTGVTFGFGLTIEGPGIPAGTTIEKRLAAQEYELSQAATATGSAVALKGVTPAGCDNGTGTAASVANPEADPGSLCVFNAKQQIGVNAFTFVSNISAGSTGIGGSAVTGAMVSSTVFEGEPVAGQEYWGTFAVTAP